MTDTTRTSRTIDATPTWRAILPIIITGLQHGTPKGQRIAKEELYRLAGIADAYIEQQQQEQTT